MNQIIAEKFVVIRFSTVMKMDADTTSRYSSTAYSKAARSAYTCAHKYTHISRYVKQMAGKTIATRIAIQTQGRVYEHAHTSVNTQALITYAHARCMHMHSKYMHIRTYDSRGAHKYIEMTKQS